MALFALQLSQMTKKLAAFLCAFVLVFLLGSASAHAATLTGWAWSETFGWISFNSTDTGAGGGPYAVSINSSGAWSGYAWSPNIGWISFNSADVSPCGSAGQLNTSTGAVTGWARALVYGGTDGCIELSGTNHTSPSSGGSGGITYDSSSGVMKGWAWGADVNTHVGLGWIQFNPSISNPVSCLGTDCGYGGNITGNCNAVTPYQNINPNTNVTFQATPSNGLAPFTYAWNPPPSNFGSSNQYTASYSSSAPGPNVIMKDANGLVTNTVSCPSVSVLTPIGSSNLKIGRTPSTAISTSLTIKQTNAFALTWNFTVTTDYSCTTSVSPDPNSTTWNTYWKAGLSSTDNGDGTKTYSGDTDSHLVAGTAAAPITPGIYTFRVSCTSSATPTPNPPQSTSVTLKINSSAQKEI